MSPFLYGSRCAAFFDEATLYLTLSPFFSFVFRSCSTPRGKCFTLQASNGLLRKSKSQQPWQTCTTSSFFLMCTKCHGSNLVFVHRCGHCKRLKPEFDKAASTLLSNDPPVNLVKVDCTEAGKDTCGRFDVRGYPTLKIFRSGELSQVCRHMYFRGSLHFSFLKSILDYILRSCSGSLSL